MATWRTIFGDQLLTKDGMQPTAAVLGDKKVVGVYFSAHWCPPCRAFTPLLSATYDELKETHPDVEIVFVSSDSDAGSFDEYYGEMPFAAIPFASHEQKQLLSYKYGASGIPTLIFLSGNGKVLTRNGRQVVELANGEVEELWVKLIALTA